MIGALSPPAATRLEKVAIDNGFDQELPAPEDWLGFASTAALPKTTEAERLIVQRVGQGIFCAGLIDYWEGRCAVTGLSIPELLRASHIKPWADCQTDAERLDIFNGILLAPHLDAAFDRGFITFADDGTVIVTADLDTETREALGLHQPLRAFGLADGHRHYLPWHREKVFRRGEVES